MRFHYYWLLVCCGFIVPALALADEKIPASRVVGTVYGKEITAAEIELKEPIDTTVKFDARTKSAGS